MPKLEGSLFSMVIIDTLISMKFSLFYLGIVIFLGTVEGVLTEYFKFVDKNEGLDVATVENEQPNSIQPTTFWTKHRKKRFIFKLSRMLVILIILSISFVSSIKVILAIMNVGAGGTNWNFLILIPSFKIYKAFTKVMSDVVNDTDDAANDASKMYPSYNTILGMYESLKTIQSSTIERETIKKTNNTEDNIQ
ncbi:hypothetical protein [Lysinibacillus fusiformis]|uniref:hypothetical protein n=1 Tax=Lysinibacillus fusiformis TaxID=28031 RepID=UPI003D02B18C